MTPSNLILVVTNEGFELIWNNSSHILGALIYIAPMVHIYFLPTGRYSFNALFLQISFSVTVADHV